MPSYTFHHFFLFHLKDKLHLCFTVSVIPSINTFESSNEFLILIISFISSFEINRFPALIAPFPLIFLSNLVIAFEAKFLPNPGKLSLAKGMARYVIHFLPILHNILR